MKPPRKTREPPSADVRHVLARVPLFSGFGPEDLRALATLAVVRRYPAKQLILRQGDPGGALFAIVSGHLKAFTQGLDGHDTLLTIMGAGEVFGEVSLFDGEPRSASVATLDKSELVILSRDSLQPLLLQSPALAIKLLEVLARRLRRLSERSEDITSLDVSRRLAKALVKLAAAYGEPVDSERIRIQLKLSQQELGDLIGATRESVNKHLRLWFEQGLARKEAGRLVLCDPHAFERMAE